MQSWYCVVILYYLLSQERIMTLKKQSSQITLQAQQERENFQREKNNLLVMLQKVSAFFARWSCEYLHLFTWTYYLDVCRRERNWHLWKENMQSCLRGRRSLTTLEPSQRWVSVTAAIYISTSRVLLTQINDNSLSVSEEKSCLVYPLWFLWFLWSRQHLQSLKERRRSSGSKENSSQPADSLPHKRSQQLLTSYGRSLGRTLPPKVFFFFFFSILADIKGWMQYNQTECFKIGLEGICNFFKRPIDLLLFLSFKVRIIQTFEKQFQNNEAHSGLQMMEISLPSLFVSRTFCPERSDPPKQEYSALQHPSSSWSTLRMTEVECFLFRPTFLCPKAPAVAASSHQASASPPGTWAPAACPRVSQSGGPSLLVCIKSILCVSSFITSGDMDESGQGIL